MKIFVTRILLHSFLLVLVIWAYSKVYDVVVQRRLGPNTQTQILQSYQQAVSRNYHTLILGNSRMYRGMNPDSLGFVSYNFAHDDDSYNQMYYKLEKVLATKKIDTLFLGVDYFSFSRVSDHRNYVYGGLLGHAYLSDYYPGYPAGLYYPLYKVSSARQVANNYMGFDRTQYLLKYVVGNSKFHVELRDQGQYIFPGESKATDAVKRDYDIKPLQKAYFEKILDLCKQQSIVVFLVMPPARANELSSYPAETIAWFDRYFASFAGQGVRYLNFSKSPGFELRDYTDITHLNEAAAGRFSRMVGMQARLTLSQKPDVE